MSGPREQRGMTQQSLPQELQAHLGSWDGVPVYDKCVMDCHVKGLHSIVAKELPGGRLLRIYVATSGNQLFKNSPESRLPMAVGFHNHRYDIGLQVLVGRLTNHVVSECGGELLPMDYRLYGYQTGLKDGVLGRPKIELRGAISIRRGRAEELREGQFAELQAREIHTISTAENEFVAWAVLEGPKDEAFKAKLITNAQLDDSVTEGLYQPASNEEVDSLLSSIKAQIGSAEGSAWSRAEDSMKRSNSG